MEIHAGSVDLLNGRRSSLILAQGKQHLLPAICFSIIAVFGIVALGLYLNDRSRRELLQIGICCLLLAPIYLDYLGAAAFLSYSSAAYFFSWAAPALVTNLTRTFFFFALARRRVPLAFWMLIAVAIVFYLATLALAFLAPGQALWLDGMRTRQIAEFSELAAVIESFAPFVAFSPWKGVSRRMKPLAVLCMAWGITMAAFFALRVTGAHIPGVPDLQARWGTPVSDVEAVVTLSVIAALLALLFREQQQTARDRTLLAGEMQAAGEIQRMLAPTTIDTAPGLKIDVAFHPMREVGGDFYLCRVLSDGRQRVLLGDVSGKGAAAAMAATLILGAAAARDSDSPAALLAHLNRVLCENHLSGFATCLCADLSPAGSVTLANAGHLSPYRRGQEIAIPAGLPLGLTPGLNSAYEQIAFELAPGDALTFLSDGVVEARNAAGTLFGFDRTQALSSQPASAIAQAAHAFGQNDDITVLTVTRLAPVSEPPPERVAPVLAPA
jgi:hypothetical protein